MEKFTVEQDVLIFDAETTGLPAKGAKWENDFADFPNLVSLSWIFQGVEKNYIIYPDGWDIPADATEIHGITTQYAIEHGTKIDVVLADFAEDILRAALVAAHNIYFDSSMVKSNVLKHLGKEFYDEYRIEEGLHKGKRVDTMMKTIKFVAAPFANGRGGNKFPTLEELYNKLFPGETFKAHDSLEDCRALQRCLPELINLEIIELKIKQYDGEQLDCKKQMEAPKPTANKIEFNDPSPVIVPGANGENIPVRDFEKSITETVKNEPETEKGLKATEKPGNNPLLDIDDF